MFTLSPNLHLCPHLISASLHFSFSPYTSLLPSLFIFPLTFFSFWSHLLYSGMDVKAFISKPLNEEGGSTVLPSEEPQACAHTYMGICSLNNRLWFASRPRLFHCQNPPRSAVLLLFLKLPMSFMQLEKTQCGSTIGAMKRKYKELQKEIKWTDNFLHLQSPYCIMTIKIHHTELLRDCICCTLL